jgi:hypothetical protein
MKKRTRARAITQEDVEEWCATNGMELRAGPITREEVERWCENNELRLSDDLDSDDVEDWCSENRTKLCKEWDGCRCTYIKPVVMCKDHLTGERALCCATCTPDCSRCDYESFTGCPKYTSEIFAKPHERE